MISFLILHHNAKKTKTFPHKIQHRYLNLFNAENRESSSQNSVESWSWRVRLAKKKKTFVTFKLRKIVLKIGWLREITLKHNRKLMHHYALNGVYLFDY